MSLNTKTKAYKSFLEKEIEKREEYAENRSERWHESDNGTAYTELTELLTEINEMLGEIIDDNK